MSNTPYGMNAIIKQAQKNHSVQNDFTTCPSSNSRSTSFLDRLVGGVVDAAEADGDNFDLIPEEKSPPPQKTHSSTVLPSLGTRRVKHGIHQSSGVFGLINGMQELDEDTFMLFYIEASREFENRTGDEGWTKEVMEHVLGKSTSEPKKDMETSFELDIPGVCATTACF